jgi:hypothetical protein
MDENDGRRHEGRRSPASAGSQGIAPLELGDVGIREPLFRRPAQIADQPRVTHQSSIDGSGATGGLTASVENKAHTGWQAARGTRQTMMDGALGPHVDGRDLGGVFTKRNRVRNLHIIGGNPSNAKIAAVQPHRGRLQHLARVQIEPPALDILSWPSRLSLGISSTGVP